MANSIGANVHVTGDFGDLEIKLNGVVKAFKKAGDEQATAAEKIDKGVKAVRNSAGLLINGQDRVIEGLAKWRVEAGMYVDEAGKIHDKNGNLVEGLTTLQQKLGMYVDKLGNVRKANGELADSLIEIKKGADGVAHSYDRNGNLVDGLERWRVEMGHFIDDLGRATDAQGRFFDGLSNAQIKGGLFTDAEGNIKKMVAGMEKVVGKTKELKEREKEAAEEARRIEEELDDIRKTWSDGLRGLGDVVSQITGNIAELSGPRAEEFVKLGNTISGFLGGAQAISNFADSLADAKNFALEFTEQAKAGVLTITRYWEGLKNAAGAAKQFGFSIKGVSTFLSLLPAGIMPATAVIGGLTAAWAAWKLTADSTKIPELSEDFKKLAEEAARAGKTIDTLGEKVQFVFSAKPQNEDLDEILKGIKEAKDKYEEARIEYERLQEVRRDIAKQGGGYGSSNLAGEGKLLDEMTAASREIQNLQTSFANQSKKIIDDVLSKTTTEAERLSKEIEQTKKAYATWKKHVYPTEDVAKRAEEDKKIRDYLAKLNDDLAKARAGEVDAAQDAANTERERAERLRNAGISAYMDQVDIPKITAESYKGVTEQWNKLVDEGLVTQEQLNDALKRAKDVAIDDLLNKLGVELPKATDELMDEFEQVAKALEDNLIGSEQAEQIREALRKKNTDELISKLGLDIKKPEKDMFDVIKEAFASGKYDLTRQAEILGAAYEKRAEELAQEQGIELGASVADLMEAQKSYAEKIRQWQEEFEAGHVTDKQLQDAKAALAKQYADEVAKRTGVDLSADSSPKSKVESILADLDKKKGEWLEYLQSEGADLSVFDKAIEQLNLQAKEALDATLPAMDKVKSTQEKYAAMMDDLKAAFEAGLYTQEEFAQRQKQINEAKAKELEAAQASVRSSLGLDRLQEEVDRLTKGEQSWRVALDKQRAAIIEAAKKGEIAENEKTKALNNLNTIIKAREKQEKDDLRKKRAEEAKRIRDDARSALGVDSIMESLKSPLQKFQETIARLNANKAFVSFEEYAAVWENAVKDYQEASKSVHADSAIQEMKSGKAKTTAGTSIQAGSSDLYKALISRQAPNAWEANMQTTTRQIHASQEEGNQLAQENNYYLQQMIALMGQQNGAVAVFG